MTDIDIMMPPPSAEPKTENLPVVIEPPTKRHVQFTFEGKYTHGYSVTLTFSAVVRLPDIESLPEAMRAYINIGTKNARRYLDFGEIVDMQTELLRMMVTAEQRLVWQEWKLDTHRWWEARKMAVRLGETLERLTGLRFPVEDEVINKS